MELHRDLYNEITEFLKSLPIIDNFRGRQAFIYSAGLDPHLRDQIPFDDPPAQFIALLMSLLLNYGTLDNGRYALTIILATAKNYVGTDKQEYCDTLIRKVNEIQKSYTKTLTSNKTVPEKLFLAKLPTTSIDFIGREKEIETLNVAWHNSHTHIVSFVAWGGAGKTALVNEWLNLMEQNNYKGAEFVYGWSFYSQGTSTERQLSSDDFLEHALTWFGDPAPMKGDAWDKGLRLAQLIRQNRTLLILDGVEPLQYSPKYQYGCIRDLGLQALLKELSRSNQGLCVVSTRVAIKDLDSLVNSSVLRIPLEPLTPAMGAKLLKKLNVSGNIKELEQLSQDFHGHALALNLVGHYLAIVYDGDVQKRDLIPFITEEEKQGEHAVRIIKSYEKWLKGTIELEILYLMGLFDRPATHSAIESITQGEPLSGFVALGSLKTSHAKWKYAISRLRELGLLSNQSIQDKNILDCHPLIREYFEQKFRADMPDAWQEANRRLYKHYGNLPLKQYPDTVREMEPLFASAKHGCTAALYNEVFESVYKDRMLRKDEFFTTRKLHIFGADLSVLSNFFKVEWSCLYPKIKPEYQAEILGLTGFRLRALGRLREALEPMQKAMELRAKLEYWKEASINAGNLSETLLLLGEIQKSIYFAQESVKFADKSKDITQQYRRRTTLADALYQAGEFLKSKELFKKAEELQKIKLSHYQYLQSVGGFRYCELLLSLKCYDEVQCRGQVLLQIAQEKNDLLDIGLHKLSLGKAYLFKYCDGNDKTLPLACEWIEQALEDIRSYRSQHHLPRALISKASLYRIQGNPKKAWKLLAEAKEIAERGSMKLFLIAYYLEVCRLNLYENDIKSAQENIAIAQSMLNETGCHQNDSTVQELIQLCIQNG